MSDAAEIRDIKENFVEVGIKVDVEATSVNLHCVKSEPNEGTLDFEEDNHSTQYKITLKYEDIYGGSSRQIKIEEDYDNLIGFLDNDVIMENPMIKLEAVKEEEDDGSFNNFYCQKCKGIYKGYCLMCSTLLHILNKNASIASIEAESNTIPTDILEIRATSRGKGVYLLRTLPINIIFGPFEGILGIESTIGHSWKIDSKLRNIKSGNWMKNIICAASASLKNLDIFQVDGNLYFQTNREITEGEELLIYYDDDELQQLDNTEECLYTPQKREKVPKIFACTVCCLGFGSNKCLMEHKWKCCRMEYSRSMDEFVLIECHYCKMWMEKWEHEKYHVAYCLEKHHRTWNNYSERVDRSNADVEEMEADRGRKDDKRTYRRREICSRPNDRRNKLKFNTKDSQWVSEENDVETRCLNECGGGGLVERSNNEQTQNNTIPTNDSHCYNNLKKHIKNTHADDSTDKDYKCSECPFETNNKRNLQNHLNKHRGITFTCDICMMTFTLKDNLKKHIRNKHAESESAKDYQCSECNYQTNVKSNLRVHQNMHKGVKPFRCDICKMTFNQKGNLTTHIKNKHTDDGGSAKDYKCLECSFETNYKSHLQRHLNRHRGIMFTCDICMMKFTQKYHLKTHIKNTHADDSTDKDYKCSHCSFQTNHKFSFQTHLNKHKGIKPFQCEICMQKFSIIRSLKMHIRNKHTADGSAKDYKCSHCSFRTNYKDNLQTHLNKHKGIKPFQCDICKVTFIQKGNLTTHIKNKHTDDGGSAKDYKCLECSFETNYKSHLQRHLNKHKGIKSFQCDICMKKFSRKGCLKRHIKNTHADDKSVKD